MVRKKTRSELELAEIKHATLIQKRDRYNAEANIVKEERDLIHEQRRHLNEELKALRDERAKIVDEMREHKAKRNECQKKAKELIELKRSMRGKLRLSLEEEVSALRREIEEMEMRQQTTTMTLHDENELLDAVKAKMVELKGMEKLYVEHRAVAAEVGELEASIERLFNQADEEHQAVLKLSQHAEELHGAIVAKVNEISHLIAEANKKHQAFLKIKEKADHHHKRAVEMRSRILAIRRERRDEARTARRIVEEQNLAVREALEDEKLIEKAADEALQLLLKKGRVELRQ